MIEVTCNLAVSGVPIISTYPTLRLTPSAVREAPRQPQIPAEIRRQPIPAAARGRPRNRYGPIVHDRAHVHPPRQSLRRGRHHRRRGVPKALNHCEASRLHRLAGAPEEDELRRVGRGERRGGEVEIEEPPREAAAGVVELEFLHEVVYVTDGEVAGMREAEDRSSPRLEGRASEEEIGVAAAFRVSAGLEREREADG